MTIETTLQVGYGQDSYILMVKMIRIELSSYFFIRDADAEKPLLSGKVLELTYLDSFSLTEFKGVVRSEGVPEKIISAIKKEILRTQDTWFS